MLVSRAGLSPVMVGRDAELGQLLRLSGGSAAVGNGGAAGAAVALVGGEPGIGKTRLVSELIGALAPVSRVLTGQADPGALGSPFHLLLDLVDGEIEGDLEAAALAGQVADTGLTVQQRAAAGATLLARICGDGPTLVVADDLHWADRESVEVLERVVDSPIGRRLLLVGTYRPEALTRRHPVAELLQRFERRHMVAHLRLERLSTADVAGFLTAVYGRSPSHRTAMALHNRTGGNPFFLEELLKAAGGEDPDELCHQPLPWTLAEALRSQLDGLSPAHRQVVEAAAVLGGRVSFDLLAAVTGTDERELIAALRELVRGGLLLESEEDQFVFRHALTREAIDGEMLGRERRRLHQAALDALRAQENPDLAAVALHAHGAGRYDDMVAAARQGSARRLAAGSSFAALKLAEMGLKEEPDDPALLSTAATAAWLFGYLEDARQHAERWLRSAEGAEQRSAALRMLVRVAWEDKDLPRMDALTAEVRTVLDSLPAGEERARAMAALAQAHMLRNRYAEAVEWSDATAAEAAALGLPEVRLAALVEKGSALLFEPDSRDAGRTMLLDVSAEAENAGHYLLAARALHNVMWGVLRSDPPRARVLLERMRTDAERAGFGGIAVAGYHEGRAQAALVAGDLDGAITALEDVRRTEGQWPPRQRLCELASSRAEAYVERGDLDQAESALREAMDGLPAFTSIEDIEFMLACRRGDLARARELLPGLGADGAVAHTELVQAQLAAAVAAGLRLDELRAIAARRSGHKKKPDSADSPLRRLTAAQLAEAEGRHDDALDGYRQAADGHPEHILPAWRASALVGTARCLLALGRTGEARAAADAAAPLLARWPGWRRDELEAVRRRLGLSTMDGNGAGGPSALTPREREVVALLAGGLSNADVARRLVISRKTAAVHVSNILAKLGMSSRAQVASWATREGLAGEPERIAK